MDDLLAELPHILSAPKDNGELKGVCIRPEHGRRKMLTELALTSAEGATGDLWARNGWLKDDDGAPHKNIQLTLINWRCISFIAGNPDRWILSGDNLAVDFDLSEEVIPTGQQLAIGDAVIEITEVWHGPCDKFRDRFGQEAVYFTAGPKWRKHRFRGVHARVKVDGIVKIGDSIKKL